MQPLCMAALLLSPSLLLRHAPPAVMTHHSLSHSHGVGVLTLTVPAPPLAPPGLQSYSSL